MKITRIIAIIGIALSCPLLSSCSKNGPSSLYGSSFWAGNYPAQLQNNDTGDIEEYTACISLEFNDDASGCVVETGIVGLLATNRTSYSVKWHSTETFTLYEARGGQTIQYYSGTIIGDKMSFEFLSCDRVERTIELLEFQRLAG